MREIKFRVYDRKYKEISLVAKLDFSNGYVITIPHNVLRIEGCDLMQYTGLKDRNGKEIYEGDILKSSSDSIGHIYRVVWEGASYWLEKGKDKDYMAFRLDTYEDHGYQKSIEGNNIAVVEIIGNIYENSELLK